MATKTVAPPRRDTLRAHQVHTAYFADRVGEPRAELPAGLEAVVAVLIRMSYASTVEFGVLPLRTWIRWTLPLADCGPDECVAVVDGAPRVILVEDAAAVSAAGPGVVRIIRAVDQ